MKTTDDKKDYLVAKARLKDKSDPVLNFKQATTLLRKKRKTI